VDEGFIKIALGVGALIVGNVLTRWWDRARPLVVLTKFASVTKNADRAHCDKELHELTRQSFSTPLISEGEVKYGEIETVHLLVKHDLDMTDNIDGWVRDTIRALKQAETDPEKVEAIKSIFRWSGLRQFVEFLFYRSLTAGISPQVPASDPPKLPLVPSEDNDGSLVVVFPDALGHLGGNFARDKWREQAIQPLVVALRSLDTHFLIRVLEKIPDLAVRQRDINRQILDKTSPIKDNHTKWVAHCTVVNYGSSPLIVHPNAHMLLEEKKGRKCLVVPCYLAEERSDTPGDARDVVGPLVLSPAQTTKLWVITQDTKENLVDGNLINAYSKDKTAMGRARLTVTERGIPLRKTCTSTPLVFATESAKRTIGSGGTV